MKVNIYVGCDPASQKDYSGTWTKLFDMSSGVHEKTDWSIIFIQADQEDAIRYANWRWDIHPDNVTCTCCGEDFFVSSGELGKIAKFHVTSWSGDESELGWEDVVARARGRDDMLLVFSDEMGDEWKGHSVHHSGYVWLD